MRDDVPLTVVLASGSRIRFELLSRAGVACRQQPAVVDEQSLREALHAEGVSSQNAAVVLAETKAHHVARTLDDDAIVIAADQLLDLDGRWLEKPVDLAAARQQLLNLRDRRHQLVSAVVGFRGGRRVWHTVDTVGIRMRNFSDRFLDGYLAEAGESVCQSVGAYQLEEQGAQLMAEVEGDYFSVLGLPLIPVLQFLRDQGLLEA